MSKLWVDPVKYTRRPEEIRRSEEMAVYEGEVLGCHPCVNTSSLRIAMEDLLKKILPAIHHEPIVVDL